MHFTTNRTQLTVRVTASYRTQKIMEIRLTCLQSVDKIAACLQDVDNKGPASSIYCHLQTSQSAMQSREVLQILWEYGPQAVRDVHEQLIKGESIGNDRPVITLLQRLEKGYVGSVRAATLSFSLPRSRVTSWSITGLSNWRMNFAKVEPRICYVAIRREAKT